MLSLNFLSLTSNGFPLVQHICSTLRVAGRSWANTDLAYALHFLHFRSLAQGYHAMWFRLSLNSPSTKDDSHHQWATERDYINILYEIQYKKGVATICSGIKFKNI